MRKAKQCFPFAVSISFGLINASGTQHFWFHLFSAVCLSLFPSLSLSLSPAFSTGLKNKRHLAAAEWWLSLLVRDLLPMAGLVSLRAALGGLGRG